MKTHFTGKQEKKNRSSAHAVACSASAKQLKQTQSSSAAATTQCVLTREQREAQQAMLARQGLDGNNMMEGVRSNKAPDRYGAPPSTHRDRMGNTFFNPGSAALHTVRMKLSGDSMKDIALLVQHTGMGGPGSGMVWHHMGDYDPQTGEGTVVLMDAAAHTAHRHVGGSAMKRADMWDDPDKKSKFGF